MYFFNKIHDVTSLRLSTLSNMSIRELAEIFIFAGDPADLDIHYVSQWFEVRSVCTSVGWVGHHVTVNRMIRTGQTKLFLKINFMHDLEQNI